MMHVVLPSSDVVDSHCPYVVRLAGEGLAEHAQGLRARVELRPAGNGAEPVSLPAEVSAPPENAPRGKAPGAGAGEWRVRLDVSGLQEGEYEGALILARDDREWREPVQFFRMPEPAPAQFPFGIYAVPVPPDRAGRDRTFARLRALGLNLICEHMSSFDEQAAVMDRAARAGLRFRPSLNVRAGDCPPDWRARFGRPSPHGPPAVACLAHPRMQALAAARFTEALAGAARHPAFSGTVYYGDDLFLAVRFAQGEAWLSCYCEHCLARYREAGGGEAPVTPEARVGTVPDDDPWLGWMRHRCADQYAGLIRAIDTARAAVAPTVAVGLCHGWPDNPFSAVATGIYGPLTQPTAVVSSYCYPFLRSPAADLICHYEIARMGQRDKEVWMLGLLAADHTVAPPWQVRQNYWNMLAAGYRSIAFFSWWDCFKIEAEGEPPQLARLEASLAALGECGRHAEWVLPVAQHWRVPPAGVAALYSFTTEAFDVAPRNHGHRHSKAVCALYREALRRQVAMEIVCEEEICDGVLERFQALCLHDVRALPAGVKAIIERFAAAGGLVLTDPDYLYTDGWHPGARVEVAGALDLAPSSMAWLLRDRHPPAVTADNDDVTVRRLTAGGLDYLVVVNNFPDRYWGMTYSYGCRDDNYRRAALVRDEPARVRLRFADPGRTLYDLASGEPLGSTADPLDLELGPSAGRVLAMLPAGRACLTVRAAAAIRCGEALPCAIEMRDGNGVRLRGAFAVRATVLAPDGRPTRQGGMVAVPDGAAEFVARFGVNATPGVWRLRFEGGLPRGTVETELSVLPAAKLADDASRKGGRGRRAP